MNRKDLLLAAAVGLGIAASGTEAFAANVTAGETVFRERCAVCHAIDAHKVCPKLRGIHGRKAGSTDYEGYIGLRRAKFTWDEASLNQFLADTKTFVKSRNPRATIGKIFQLQNAQERADVIEYLKTVN